MVKRIAFNQISFFVGKKWYSSMLCYSLYKNIDDSSASPMWIQHLISNNNVAAVSPWTYHLQIQNHDDVIKWKHFPRNWPFVRGIHRSPVNSPHKGQWRGALMFSLICARINGWVNNREAGDLRRYRAHYDVIVMHTETFIWWARQV